MPHVGVSPLAVLAGFSTSTGGGEAWMLGTVGGRTANLPRNTVKIALRWLCLHRGLLTLGIEPCRPWEGVGRRQPEDHSQLPETAVVLPLQAAPPHHTRLWAYRNSCKRQASSQAFDPGRRLHWSIVGFQWQSWPLFAPGSQRSLRPANWLRFPPETELAQEKDYLARSN